MISRILLLTDEKGDCKITQHCQKAGFEVEVMTYSQIKGHVPLGNHICLFNNPKNPLMLKRLLQFEQKNPEVPKLWCVTKNAKIPKTLLNQSLGIKPSQKQITNALSLLQEAARWSMSQYPRYSETNDISAQLKVLVGRLSNLSPKSNVRFVMQESLNLILKTDPQMLDLDSGGRLRQAPFIVSHSSVGEKEFLTELSSGHSQFCIKLGAFGVLFFENTQIINWQFYLNQIDYEIECALTYLNFGFGFWQAKNLSYIDELTGLFNQKYLALLLDREIERSRRQTTNFTVLFLDIDYFKRVNDSKGHLVGSKLLIACAEVLKDCIRLCDFAFRYGGDEFVVVLPNANAQESQVIAQRIRAQVEQTPFLIDGSEIRLTISIGLAAYPQHAETSEQIIRMADEALYQGKNKSRNIVYIAS